MRFHAPGSASMIFKSALAAPVGFLKRKTNNMSRHNEMPPVPPANRSHKGDNTEVSKDTSKKRGEVNTAEQGDTANIKQNTTNAGFFKGRRVK
jgi:hypothetical protein